MIDEYGRVSNLEKKRKENGIIIHWLMIFFQEEKD
jgi:hypothetical protein